MLQYCFLSFEHNSSQQQVSTSLLALTHSVKCLQHERLLAISSHFLMSMSIALISDALEAKTKVSSCPFVDSQFPIEKDLLNPLISRLLLLMFCHCCEVMFSPECRQGFMRSAGAHAVNLSSQCHQCCPKCL